MSAIQTNVCMKSTNNALNFTPYAVELEIDDSIAEQGSHRISRLYAYSHDEVNLHGLETQRMYVYIGESHNPRQRLEQHLPDNEQNPPYRKYLREKRAIAKCWYCPMIEISTSPKKKTV